MTRPALRAAGVCVCAGAMALAVAATAGNTFARGQLPPIRVSSTNTVPVCVTPDRLMAFVRTRNPSVPTPLRDIARTYKVVGAAFGVRWDMAFFQMLVETNDLTFRTTNGRPLYIRPEHHNFGGLTANGPEPGGEQFASPTLGVQAHIEHTLVYAGRQISAPVAERTRNLIAWRVLEEWQQGFDRPITFSDMALRWNPFRGAYADEIVGRAAAFYARHCPGVTAFGVSGAETVATTSSMIGAPRVSTAWVSRPVPSDQASNASATPTNRITPPRPRLANPGAPSSQPSRLTPPQPAKRPETKPARLASLARPSARQPENVRRAPVTAPKAQATRKPKPKPRAPTANDRIKTLVSGRLVHLTADFGAVIPVLFRTNGTMRGQAGNLAFFLGAAQDKGRWWVNKGMLCKQWSTWFKGNEVCLRLTKRGRTVHWRSRDGRSGTAKIIR